MDVLLNPTTIVIIGALMFVECAVLTRLFARRGDGRNVGITVGNVLAGLCLMAAVASEMSDQATWITGALLLGALVGHGIEVWLRLR